MEDYTSVALSDIISLMSFMSCLVNAHQKSFSQTTCFCDSSPPGDLLALLCLHDLTIAIVSGLVLTILRTCMSIQTCTPDVDTDPE